MLKARRVEKWTNTQKPRHPLEPSVERLSKSVPLMRGWGVGIGGVRGAATERKERERESRNSKSKADGLHRGQKHREAS